MDVKPIGLVASKLRNTTSKPSLDAHVRDLIGMIDAEIVSARSMEMPFITFDIPQRYNCGVSEVDAVIYICAELVTMYNKAEILGGKGFVAHVNAPRTKIRITLPKSVEPLDLHDKRLTVQQHTANF
jgi:hypothetical protein